MDQPLFGEQRQGTAFLQYVVAIVVVAFTIVTLVSGTIKGIHDAKLFALVASLIILFVNLVILTKWYRDKDDRLHPKFKWLMVTLVLAVILMCAASQPFIWYKPPKPILPPACPGGLIVQALNLKNETVWDCYSIAGGTLDQCMGMTPGMCLMYNGAGFTCQNCTTGSSQFAEAESYQVPLLN